MGWAGDRLGDELAEWTAQVPAKKVGPGIARTLAQEDGVASIGVDERAVDAVRRPVLRDRTPISPHWKLATEPKFRPDDGIEQERVISQVGVGFACQTW